MQCKYKSKEYDLEIIFDEELAKKRKKEDEAQEERYNNNLSHLCKMKKIVYSILATLLCTSLLACLIFTTCILTTRLI